MYCDAHAIQLCFSLHVGLAGCGSVVHDKEDDEKEYLMIQNMMMMGRGWLMMAQLFWRLLLFVYFCLIIEM